MTTTTMDQGVFAQFDLADRLRRSLRVTGIGVQEMADYLGVSRNAVGTWINGRISPDLRTLRLWSLRTGAPLEWLQNDETPTGEPGEGEVVRPEGFEPPTFWLGFLASLTSRDAWELAA